MSIPNFNKGASHISILSDFYAKLFFFEGVFLRLTTQCNLRCKYCYYTNQTSKTPENGSLSIKQIKPIFELLNKQGTSKELALTFFGGEPLLKFPLIKQIVQVAREYEQKTSRNFRFAITTNGTLLTKDIADFLKDNKFSVCVSLDGNSEIMDELRPFRDGTSSHLKTFSNLALLDDFQVRATITNRNLDIESVVLSLRKLKIGKFSFRTAYHDDGQLTPSEDLQVISKSVEGMVEKIIQGAKDYDSVVNGYFSNMFPYIEQLPNTPMPCGFLVKNLTIDGDGKIYPCHALAGNPNYLVGDIYCGIDPRKTSELLHKFFECRDNYCAHCEILGVCRGGCFYENFDETGACRGPNPSLCDFKKRMFSCAKRLYNSKNIQGGSI